MTAPAKTVEIALPVPFRRTFTYDVPPALQGSIELGCRVIVPFRKRRMVGMVVAQESKSPEKKSYDVKSVLEVVEGGPIISPEFFELLQWVADYYFAPIGEVIRSACPPALSTSTRQMVRLTEKGASRLRELHHKSLSPSLFNPPSDDSIERKCLEELFTTKEVDLSTLKKKFKNDSWKEWLKRLQARGEIRIRSQLGKRLIREKQEATVRLAEDWKRLREQQKISPQQQTVLKYLTERAKPVATHEVVSALGVSLAIVRTLAKKGWVQWEHQRIDRTPVERAGAEEPSQRFELTADQTRALRIVEESIGRGRFSPILLYGVTASGKTEVYLRAMERALAEGGSALLLVPEISLTPAAARVFSSRFLNRVAVLHSGLSEGERHDEWWRIKRGEATVVIGTRSAVFAPIDNLRLIVVDEEHEGSYKQQESPRYHGRDVAVMRAKMSRATILLGSATPSLESFHNAQHGKYHLIALKNRIELRALAGVEIVDMRKEFQETKKNVVLSRTLLAGIEARLRAGEQVLVLLNRRGYSSFVVCRSCGSTRQCPNCSITLTYHKHREILLCHYCAAVSPVPQRCRHCDSEHLYFVGQGTEQVEEKLREKFPLARIARLDRDTAQGRSASLRILSEFGAGTTDILVGTQMIAKGHDFPQVTLVGVLNADGALGFPDFRAAERTFQLLTQVAGRAGRGTIPGEVILQAFYPEHYAIRAAARQNFIDFFNKEIHFRQMMHYPPYAELALVGIRHPNYEEAMALAKSLGAHLRATSLPEVRVLGPAIAPLARVKNEFRWQLLIKSKRHQALQSALRQCLEFCERRNLLEPNVSIDVDPNSMM